MEKVKQMVEAGVSVPTAIRETLGVSVTEFADEIEYPRQYASDTINLVRRPDLRFLNGIAARCGGTPAEWEEFLWLATKPARATA